jgi:hypothetical protein
MEQINSSFIQTNERIINKEKIYKKKLKGNKCIKIILFYGLVNIILFIYIFLFHKKSANNNEMKYLLIKII